MIVALRILFMHRGLSLRAVLVNLQFAFQLVDPQLKRDDTHQHFVLILFAQITPLLRIRRLMVADQLLDRKSTRMNSSHRNTSRMPSSA